jgi:hypothetical protein
MSLAVAFSTSGGIDDPSFAHKFMNPPSEAMHLSILSEPIGPIDDSDLIAVDRQQLLHDGDRLFDQQRPQQRHNYHSAPVVTALNDWDVPMGRGRMVREFIGNSRYRDLVETYRVAYLNTVKRKDKREIAIIIYNSTESNGGRFLAAREIGAKNESWYEITKDKALAKIGQALRIGVRPPPPPPQQSAWTYPMPVGGAHALHQAPPRPLFVNVPRQFDRQTSLPLDILDSLSNESFTSEEPLGFGYGHREFEGRPETSWPQDHAWTDSASMGHNTYL